MNVLVTWSASGGADAYTVYRSMAQGNQGSAIGTTTTTSFTDTSIGPGVTYWYGVTAKNVAGESALSSQSSVAVPAVPDAPTNLTATLVP